MKGFINASFWKRQNLLISYKNINKHNTWMPAFEFYFVVCWNFLKFILSLRVHTLLSVYVVSSSFICSLTLMRVKTHLYFITAFLYFFLFPPFDRFLCYRLVTALTQCFVTQVVVIFVTFGFRFCYC